MAHDRAGDNREQVARLQGDEWTITKITEGRGANKEPNGTIKPKIKDNNKWTRAGQMIGQDTGGDNDQGKRD